MKNKIVWFGHTQPNKQQKKSIKMVGNIVGTYSDSYFRGRTSCAPTIMDSVIKRINEIINSKGATVIISNLEPRIIKKLKKLNADTFYHIDSKCSISVV